MGKLVINYFETVREPPRYLTVAKAYRQGSSLSEPSSTQRNDVLLGRYASKVKSCLTSEDTSYNFKETFKSALLEPDVKLSRDYELAQRRVTGSMLTDNGILKANPSNEVGADSIDNLFEDNNPSNPIQSERTSNVTIVTGSSIYQLQTPSKAIPSPNKPALQNDDIEQLSLIADIGSMLEEDIGWLLKWNLLVIQRTKLQTQYRRLHKKHQKRY
ncbi:hypothetical protein HPULCUR_004695 [Helicostylum pulchrum]|uniref:Uncharacterized protein n=1 Tax=Helicostylum pulchrum TaxID=562976 RepID=A0ABP9XY05_9FUNG